MKNRNYEKMDFVIFLSIVLFFSMIVFFFFLFHQKEFSYQKLIGVIVSKNHIMVVVDEKEKNLFYHNKRIYYQGREYSYTILDVRESDSYYELFLEVSTPKKRKTNELFEFSIPVKKESIMSLFQKVWVGD